GDLEDGEIVARNGPGVIPVNVRIPRETRVTIVPHRLHFDDAPLTEVTVDHPASSTRDTFTFTSHDRVDWFVPIRPDEPLNYVATITHFPHAGDPVILDPIEQQDKALVIPPYVAPQPGVFAVRFMPTLIDFAETPLVTVDLVYEDEANDFTNRHSLAFADPGEVADWEIGVPDRARTLFQMTTTYFVAPDNRAEVMPPEFPNRNLIVLPPFRPGTT
ncbi:MAG: hypothetical protein AAGE03_04075, partial [Pseudomonadota bacterium]